MASITLKALPDSLHQQLKSRAAQNKRSLNQEVIATLETALSASRPVDVEALIARTRDLRASLSFQATAEDMAAFKREGRP